MQYKHWFMKTLNPRPPKTFFVLICQRESGYHPSLDFDYKASDLILMIWVQADRYGSPLSIGTKNVPIALHFMSHDAEWRHNYKNSISWIFTENTQIFQIGAKTLRISDSDSFVLIIKGDGYYSILPGGNHPSSATFVSKALWYRTFKLPDLKPLQNVPKHSLFKVCKFHEKINGHFFARGQNVLFNAHVLRL